jgi:pimeloyl-ACP methyl ester carboxylesterase
VNEIFSNHLPASGKKEISIYFHGGVVSSTTELGAPGFPYRPENQGLLDNLGQKSYPIFVVWETGLVETLKSIGQDIGDDPFKFLYELANKTSQSELFKKAAAHITSALSKKAAAMLGLGLAGEAQVPPPLPVAPIEENLDRIPDFEPEYVDYEELTAEDQAEFVAQLAQDEELNDRLREIAEEGAVGLAAGDRAQVDYVGNDLMEDINEDYDTSAAGLVGVGEVLFPLVYKKLGTVLLAIIKRFVSKRHHDFVPTLFEELTKVFVLQKFSALLWKQMKDNAAEAYAANEVGEPEPHGGAYLIEQLKAYLLAHPETQVNLVGHSAGSIQISHFVETADEIFKQDLPNFKFKNIILLAPGADFPTFAKIRTRPQRFETLRIFTMLEELEKADHMIPVVYPHSILYFVSGMADRDDSGDRPILGLARHLDRRLFRQLGIHDAQVEAAHDFIDQLTQSSGSSPVVWTTTKDIDPLGRRSNANRHGRFDNDPLTLDSVISYL